MKLSLRKANAVMLLLAEQFAETPAVSVSIGRHQDAKTVVEAAALQYKEGVGKKLALIRAYYALRLLVAKAGMEVGVGECLTELAHIATEDKFYKTVAAAREFQKTLEVLNAEIVEAREPETRRYGGGNVTTSLLTAEDVAEAKANVIALRKRKQKVSDKLLHLNVSTEIELDEQLVAVLKKYDII